MDVPSVSPSMLSLASVMSLMGVLAFVQTYLHTLFPPELRSLLGRLLARLSTCFSNYCYFDIADTDGVSTNELYNAVQLYLSNSASVSGSRVSLTRAPNSSTFTFGLSSNDRLVDTFRAKQATWEHVVTQRQAGSFSWRPVPDEKRGFVLCLRKKDRAVMMPAYLDHIMEQAADIRRRSRDRLLYTNSGRGGGGVLDSRGMPWESVPFKHPSTFDTLAMDPARKVEIMEDLREFVKGGEFYKKTGRAWKRGYLLYGPPGTGKSSMIAAMSNFLGYDVYDLELTEVHTNSDLRKLLMKTTSKSIIVIEDIDCSLTLGRKQGGGRPTSDVLDPYEVDPATAAAAAAAASVGRPGAPQVPTKSITLSGLLNFTDGLWSCCGSERIFVFTTNHVERLDPALLRSGRMDMHIHMSYCSFPSLKILIRNYLNGPSDEDGGSDASESEAEVVVLRELESVVDAAKITPADVSEVLIRNRRRERHVAMGELLIVLKGKIAAATRNRKVSTGGESSEGEEVEEKRALDSPSSCVGRRDVAALAAEEINEYDPKDGKEVKGQD